MTIYDPGRVSSEELERLREMVRSSRPQSGSMEAHDAWDDAIDVAYATIDRIQAELLDLRAENEALREALRRAGYELAQWVFADGSAVYRVERAERIIADALAASPERDAEHPCPKGEQCALNEGAVRCKHCGRNWPPDETWQEAATKEPRRDWTDASGMSGETIPRTVLLAVGSHESVTCDRCATTFASVHPACPKCSQEFRDAVRLAEIERAGKVLVAENDRLLAEGRKESERAEAAEREGRTWRAIANRDEPKTAAAFASVERERDELLDKYEPDTDEAPPGPPTWEQVDGANQRFVDAQRDLAEAERVLRLIHEWAVTRDDGVSDFAAILQIKSLARAYLDAHPRESEGT